MAEKPKDTNGEKNREEPKDAIPTDFIYNLGLHAYLKEKGEDDILAQLEKDSIKKEDLERAHKYYKEFEKETKNMRDSVTPELIKKVTEKSPEFKSALEQTSMDNKDQVKDIITQLEVLYSVDKEKYDRITGTLGNATERERKDENKRIEEFCHKENIPTKDFKELLDTENEEKRDEAIEKIVMEKAGFFKRMGWKIGKKLDISSIRMNLGFEKINFEDKLDEIKGQLNQDIKDLGELLYASLYATKEDGKPEAKAIKDKGTEAEAVKDEEDTGKAESKEDEQGSAMEYFISNLPVHETKKKDEDELTAFMHEFADALQSGKENIHEPAHKETLDEDSGEEKGPPSIPKGEKKDEKPKREPKAEDEKKEEERHIRKGKFELRKSPKGKDQWVFERTNENGVLIQYIVDSKGRQPASPDIEYKFKPVFVKKGEPLSLFDHKNKVGYVIKLVSPFPEEKPPKDDELEKIADEFLDGEGEEAASEVEKPAEEEPKPSEPKETPGIEEETEVQKEIDPEKELRQINKILNSSSLGKVRKNILRLIKKGGFDNAIKILDEDKNKGKFDEKIFEHIENLSGESYESLLKKFSDEISSPPKKEVGETPEGEKETSELSEDEKRIKKLLDKAIAKNWIKDEDVENILSNIVRRKNAAVIDLLDDEILISTGPKRLHFERIKSDFEESTK